MHPARMPAFAQAGVDDRIPRPALLPALQILGKVVPPGQPGKSLVEGGVSRMRKMKKEVISEFTPADFPQVAFGPRTQDMLPLASDGRDDLPGRDFTEMQVWRQTRRASLPGNIPARLVTGEAFVDKFGQAPEGALLADRPAGVKTRIPGYPRQQIQRLQGFRMKPGRRRRQDGGRRFGGVTQALIQHRLPERREDPVGITTGFHDFPRLVEQGSVVGGHP